MMKQKSQYELGSLSLGETTKNSRLAMRLKDKMGGKLSWIWEWQQALHHAYAQSNLKALVNDWSGTRAVPALVYVRVEDITYRGHAGR